MRKSFIQSSFYKSLVFIVLYLCINTILTAQISGTVFFDGNNNGVKDAPEVGFAGVTINAYNSVSNTPVATGVSSFTGTVGS